MSNGGRFGGSTAAGFSKVSEEERYAEDKRIGATMVPISLEICTITTKFARDACLIILNM